MTKAKAFKLLQYKKIYVGDKNKEIQDRLLECGFKRSPFGLEKYYLAESVKFLYIYDKNFSYGSDMDIFFNEPLEQISIKELFDIKIEPEFKDGDYIALYEDKELIYISIFKGYDDSFRLSYAYVWDNRISIEIHGTGIKNDDYIIQPASLNQINELDTKLKNLGKCFNKETKCIEDIKPVFVPFQKVLVRDTEDEEWKCDFFSCNTSSKTYSYVCVGSRYFYCIPYEGNEHLVGKV